MVFRFLKGTVRPDRTFSKCKRQKFTRRLTEENGGKTSPSVNEIMSISYMLILPVISTSSPILMLSKNDSSSSSSWVQGEKKKALEKWSQISPNAIVLLVCLFVCVSHTGCHIMCPKAWKLQGHATTRLYLWLHCVRFFTKIRDQIKNPDYEDFLTRKEMICPKTILAVSRPKEWPPKMLQAY